MDATKQGQGFARKKWKSRTNRDEFQDIRDDPPRPPDPDRDYYAKKRIETKK